MIQSFGSRETEELYVRGRHPRWHPELCRRATRKLAMIDSAIHISDLLSPPGNRLERLSGAWAGFHSIRINQQWRIVFRWSNGAAWEVEIVDYH